MTACHHFLSDKNLIEICKLVLYMFKMYDSWLLGVAIFAVVGRCWEHTAGNELEGLIEGEEHVLVACKFEMMS
jgi:hypothetical protein